MAQQILVAVLVVAAAAYALWHFLPARWRRALVARLGLQPGAARGGCHTCADCSACAAPAENSSKKRHRPL